MRQLEGRSLASDAAKPKGKQQPAAYNAAAAQAGGSGLLADSGAKAYNAAADVVPVSYTARRTSYIGAVCFWSSLGCFSSPKCSMVLAILQGLLCVRYP